MTETASGGPAGRISLEHAHATAERLRLRVRGKPEAEVLSDLADRLIALPGVERVVIRPNTGSIIVTTSDTADAVLEHIAALEGVRIAEKPKPPPLDRTMQFGLLKLDADIKSRTDEALDLRAILVLLLLVAALVQLTRGHIAGPATTLAMAAYSLLDFGRGR
jgi:hypothetical protein